MQTKAVVFDLDDTLIDTKPRHYRLVQDFLTARQLTVGFSYQEYLEARRSLHLTNQAFLKKFVPDEITDSYFQDFWLGQVEQSTYLALDKVLVDHQLLEQLSLSNDLYILSLRSDAQQARQQMYSFRFDTLFRKISFLKHQQEGNPKTLELLKLKKQYDQICMVGDAETDRLAAEEAGVNFFSVDTGTYQLDHSPHFADINTFIMSYLAVGSVAKTGDGIAK